MKNMVKLKNRKKINIFNLWLLDKTIIKKVCDDILNNVLYIREEYPVVNINSEMWNSTSLDRSVEFWIHSLLFIDYLVIGYNYNGKKEYLLKALEMVVDWFNVTKENSSSEFVWHDHSTALRVICISNLFEHLKTLYWDEEKLYILKEIVQKNCEKLSSIEFYIENHNHGLDQDIALFIGATVFSNMDKSSEWKNIAYMRLNKQIDSLFYKDGSYKEHSPQYSYILYKRLMNFFMFVKDNTTFDCEDLKKKLTKQYIFINDILHPGNLIPNIGDSSSKSIILPGKEYLDNELLNYNFIGNKKAIFDSIYPDGGYAIFRNKKQLEKNTKQLIFYSSFHSRVHKHHDDLSILLFADNAPVLIDSGKYSYNYADGNRSYIESRIAHNTVVVDDMDTEVKRLNIGKSGLTDYFIHKDISFSSGIQCLYDGIVQERIVIFLKANDFIILDILKGYKEHKFEQIFNFHPDIHCNLNDEVVIGEKNNGFKINISPLKFDKDIELYTNLFKGEKGNFRGWCSLEYNKLKENYSLGYVKKGKKVKFATYIRLNSQNLLKDFKWEDDSIIFNYDDVVYKMILGRNKKYILINENLFDSIKINQDKIDLAIEESKQYEYRNKYFIEREKRVKLQNDLQGNTGIINIKLESYKKTPQNLNESIEWTCYAEGEKLQYAWYIYRNGENVFKSKYCKSNKFKWKPGLTGQYIIKVFIKDNKGNKEIKKSSKFYIV